MYEDEARELLNDFLAGGSKAAAAASSSSAGSGGNFKSKEFISDDSGNSAKLAFRNHVTVSICIKQTAPIRNLYLVYYVTVLWMMLRPCFVVPCIESEAPSDSDSDEKPLKPKGEQKKKKKVKKDVKTEKKSDASSDDGRAASPKAKRSRRGDKGSSPVEYELPEEVSTFCRDLIAIMKQSGQIV